MISDTNQQNSDVTLGRLFGQLDAKQNLEEIFQAIADGVIVQDESRRVVFANAAAVALMDFNNKSEIINHLVSDAINKFEIFDENGNPVSFNDLPARSALDGLEVPSKIVLSRNRQTGSEFWSEIKARPIRDSEGKVRFAVSIFRDITAQRNIQSEYEKINRRNQHILESITDGFFALDKDWNFTYVNRQAEQLLQRNRSELLGKNIFQEFPNAMQTATYSKLQEALLENKSLRYEEKFSEPGNMPKWIESSVYPAKDGLAVYLRDITPQKTALEANLKLVAIVESSEDAIMGKDLEGNITSWNKGAVRIYGYTEQEILGKNVSVLVPEGFPDDTRMLLAQIRLGRGVNHYETKRKTKDGRILDISVAVSPIKNNSGKVVGASAVARDITKSKQADEGVVFLSEATKLLSSSLDFETTLARVAKLAVPKFADWCGIEILTPDGENTKQVAVEHVDPEKIKFAVELARKYPNHKDPERGTWKIITTGKAEIYKEITDDMLRASSRDPEHYELTSKLGIKSALMVPLVARDKVFGVMSLIWAESNKRYEEKDLKFFEELGRRAGMAIDNALLYREAQIEIRERKFMEQKLQVSEERYRAIIDNTSDGVALLDANGVLTFATMPVQRMLGYTSEEMHGVNIRNIVHPDDAPLVAELLATSLRKPDQTITAQYRCRHANGNYRWIEGVGTNLLHHPSIRAMVVNFRDITERRLAEENLQYQYHHDTLTDLPNRTYLNERFAQAISDAEANGQNLGIMLLDLDRFKQINESLGHALGDRLIQEVALRVRSCVKEDYVLARLGGDEFAILMADIQTEEEAAKLANKILEDFRPAFYLDQHELFISPSIGISLYPYDGREASSLLRNAEAALYRAKEYGRNTYQFYTTTMNSAAYERLTLDSKLRHALENQEFVLFYQPQVDVATGKIVGTEELIRWQRPDMTLILPDRFIPLAEANGLIEPIGEWILKEALKQGKMWHDAGYKMIMAINLSARQFKQKNFENVLIGAIEESKFDARFLELELTESILAENEDNITSIMNALRERGVRFCLDDFSTGYSSLRYIKHFPVDMLKIERTFMKGIPMDMQNSAIAKSIITLGRSLNMEITAEGVESKNQLAFLRENMCNRAQGYLFNGAMPAHSLSEILNEDRYVSVVASLGKPALF
ncbi:MAG: PAS domain S-box protein [Candidatus Doudnabacteria bacterium]|nr:PAS domain S-box protein [Candidatus Doudnabacteria bacterium]